MSSETIKIYCRIRPIDEPHCRFNVEQDFKSSAITFTRSRNQGSRSNYIDNTREEYVFKFDGLLTEDDKQEDTFKRTTLECVKSSLDGFNSTIFAYGQTGSGKTWSITGGPDHYEDRGIIPRSVEYIFNEIEKRKTSDNYEYVVSVSYLELYLGRGYDLLVDNVRVNDIHDLPHVTMFEDGDGNMLLKNISCRRVNDAGSALELLWLGDNNRTLAETDMNLNSSRSHCIFTLNIESKKPGSASVKYSKLHIVDLAGSERIYKTETELTMRDEGRRRKLVNEAAGINLSLMFLEQVIVALSEKRSHVPYRNSMLTTVLRDSIGGNCKTVMLANINPSDRHLPETISTCKFAQRVASIRQNVRANTKVDSRVLIRQLQRKIVMLKEKLAFYEKGDREEKLGTNDFAIVKQRVLDYCRETDYDSTIDLGGNYARIVVAFKIFRDIVNEREIDLSGFQKESEEPKPKKKEIPEEKTAPKEEKKEVSEGKMTLDEMKVRGKLMERIKQLKVQSELKELEINLLVQMLAKKNEKKRNIGIQTGFSGPIKSSVSEVSNGNVKEEIKKAVKTRALQEQKKYLPTFDDKMIEIGNKFGMVDRAKAFQIFRKTFRKNEILERKKVELRGKYETAKKLSREVNIIRQNVNRMKSQLVSLRTKKAALILVDGNKDVKMEGENETKDLILRERDKYMRKCEELKRIKKEIEYIQRGLEQSRIRMLKDFERWYQTTAKYANDEVKPMESTQKSSKIHENLSLESIPNETKRNNFVISPKNLGIDANVVPSPKNIELDLRRNNFVKKSRGDSTFEFKSSAMRKSGQSQPRSPTLSDFSNLSSLRSSTFSSGVKSTKTSMGKVGVGISNKGLLEKLRRYKELQKL